MLEKSRIERDFPCFRCELRGNHLVCRGDIVPAEGCDVYRIVIDHVAGDAPTVRITEPEIKPSSQYHLYSDGCLCL